MPTPSGSDHQGRSLANAAFAASVSVILLALLALAGFFFKSPTIASLIGTSIPMAPATAACFLILTAALLFKNSGRPRGDLALRAGAAVTLAICAAAALNTPAAGQTMESIPLWRMSPFSGALFLLATVWFFLRAARGPGPNLYGLAAAAALALLSSLILTGYLYGSPFLYGGHTIPVSFPTGAAFLGLSAALLASDPDSLKLTPFYGDSAEAVLFRNFLPLTAAAVLLNGLLNMGNRTFLDSKPALNALSALLALSVAAWLARRVSRSVGERLALAQKRQLESEQIFREFMEHSPIYVFFKDENIRSLRLSRNFEKMLGRPVGELLGKNMNELFPSDFAEKMVADDLRIIKEGKEISIEEELNGRRYVTTKFPIKLEGKPPYLAGYTIDVTETKLREDMDKARLHLLNFSFSHTLDELLQETLDEAEKLTRSQVGFCHFLEADQQTLSLQNWSTRTKAEFCKAEGKGRHYPVAEAGVWTDCIRERKPVIHNDYASLPHRKGLPPGHAPVKRELVVPVFRAGRIVAILGVGNKASEYDRTDVNTVVIFANLVWDIAERKLAEEQAARMTERVLLAARAAKLGVWDWDLESKVLTWDKNMFDLYGVKREAFPGAYEAWLNGVHPDDRARCDEESRRAVEGERAYDTEFRIVRPDGEVRWLKASADIFRDADGRPKRMVGVNFDITGIRRAEEKLRESEERLRVTLEETKVGTWDWDVTNDIWQASPTYYTMLGYEAQSGPSDRRVWLNRVHPDDRPGVAAKIADVLSGTKEKYQYEARLLHADGTYKWHLVRGTTVKQGSEGKPARMMGVRIDITQLKLAEEALLKSEKDLKEAQRLARIGNWTLDLVSNKLAWSEEIFRIFELDRERFGASYDAFLEAIHPEDRERVNKAYTDSLKNRTQYDITHRLLMKDGRIKYVTEFCETFYDPSGRPVKSIGTVQDITERKAAEEALRTSEEQLRSLWMHMAEGVALHELVCDTEGKPVNYRIVDTNPQYEKILKLRAEDIKGRLATEAYGTTVPPYLKEYSSVVRSGIPARLETHFPPLNKHFSISIAPWKDNGFATIFADVTEQRIVELERERLNRVLAEKNKEMENFLYITTHDLRSPLVNIQGFSQNLKRYLEEMKVRMDVLEAPVPQKAELQGLMRSKLTEALDFILGSSRKMDDLITALLKVSRAGHVEMKPERVDISGEIKAILAALHYQLEESGGSVKMGDLPPCLADRGAVNQIFTNLLDNAVKYRDKSRALKIEISAERREGAICYKVADNGPGIPAKDLSRIWNVFYSHEHTSERSGEGIGLPMVRRMTERNGGSIRAESKEGEGLSFYIELPAAEGPNE